MLESFNECIVIGAAKCRVSFLGGTKVVIDAEMYVDIPAFEPEPSATGELRWFRHLVEAEESRVKLPSPIFAARRNRELNVVELCEGRHALAFA
jgi:hypothetical protein